VAACFQNFSLTFFIHVIELILYKSSSGVRELAPAFLFGTAISTIASSEQPKSHPLGSTTYEMLILQLFSFDIHAN
jgi:hypothetical protein